MRTLVKLLMYCHEPQAVADVVDLLRRQGIPTYVKKASHSMAPYRRAIFICLDDQITDAVACLRNPVHRVARPIDVEAFARQDIRAMEVTLFGWGGALAIVLAAAVFLISVWLSA